jgi:formate hydrogenlyase subunit 4
VAVLNATATVVDGAPQNSATGVYLYVLISGILFVLAAVTATTLARLTPRRAAPVSRGRHARV